ncbi:hypothetical protein C361_02258 [Cryptococcus neoformans Tu259-1]|uniref:Uncharacterized protein n=1 Tax=Cryptococcus neoformans Tu259-1 TaxID=1230072 RepID=A0A854QKG1_CRYNE|nr:hypothetical protein C361_02258 [Cryptococcus neoformans var. grubii Tu259-1]OXG66637.1 hypothetical protein C351_01694 [Cryptococcus neoformans var. grubii c8]
MTSYFFYFMQARDRPILIGSSKPLRTGHAGCLVERDEKVEGVQKLMEEKPGEIR